MKRYQGELASLRAAVLDGRGELDKDVRQAAATPGAELPEDVTSFVEKVRTEAFKVTDEDIAALRAAGYSEDQIFELTVCTALGAGLSRLDTVRKAMKGS